MRLTRSVAALGAGLAAVVLTTVPAPGAPAQEAAPSYSFVSASSGGDGVRVLFDIVGFLPVTPALSLGSVSAEGFVESSRRTAVALLPDPGGTVVAAPGLVAGLVGVPNIPAYPLVARADDPFVPSAEASPVGGAGVGVIRAEAGADRAWALARVGGAGDGSGLTGLAPVNELIGALAGPLGLDALTGGVLDVGSVEVEVEELRTSPSQLTATATSRLAGLRLLGGLVQIASVETRVSVALDGATASTEEPTVEVGGVTVAGIPAQITEDGLQLAGSASPLGGLLAPLLDPLLDQGLALRVTPSEAVVEGTTARARSGALVLEVTSAYQGYPVVLRITFGEVRAAVQGSGATAPRPVAATPSTPAAPVAAGGGSPTPATAAASPVVPGPSATPARPAASAPLAAATPAAVALPEVLDFRRLYPPLALLAFVLGGSRLLAASLLRRRGTPADVRELYRW